MSDAKSRSRDFAELGTSARGAVISEADEALVEGGVPQGGEQKAIVDVEALHVVAFRPGHNVRSAEQPGLGRRRRPARAHIQQRLLPLENSWADALDDQTLGLGGARQAGGLGVEAVSCAPANHRRQAVRIAPSPRRGSPPGRHF